MQLNTLHRPGRRFHLTNMAGNIIYNMRRRHQSCLQCSRIGCLLKALVNTHLQTDTHQYTQKRTLKDNKIEYIGNLTTRAHT